jgi:hypothetical protein
MERILFGDNQFFGVNHMSEEKARAQAVKFRDTASIMKVLDAAYEQGIRVFMCTTHDRVGAIVEQVRANPSRYDGFQFYPCMPYAHKYANSVGEVGILETIRRFAPGGVLETLIKGAIGAVSQDAHKLMRLLVDAEMRRFDGVQTPLVFVQNVVTDLMLGLGMQELLAGFAAHVRSRYGAEAGFITMNLPLLVDRLESVGITNPIVCANINKIGFRMSGGVDAYRELLRARRCRAIAMSIFASGAIPPREAIDWVCGLEGLDAVVFGASSADHVRQSKALLEQAWGPQVAQDVA